MGLGITQFGLLYHAKTVLNYATFEAARAGATNNAQIEVMRKELGYRLAAVYGGDGSAKTAAMALTRSMVAVNDTSATKIEILNPTEADFLPPAQGGHGVIKSVVDRHENTIPNVTTIPNSHMRYRADSFLTNKSIKDANLLKIKVTYGYQMRMPFLDMRVPLADPVLRHIMGAVDPDNMLYYMRGMIPIESVATVRMQSEAWSHQESPLVERAFDSAKEWVDNQINGDSSDPDGFSGDNTDPNNPYANNVIDDLSADPDGPPLECEEGGEVDEDGNPVAPDDSELDEDQGFFGNVWDRVKGSLGAAYDFVRGFWQGMKNQLTDLANIVAHPIETAQGLIELGKAFIDKPEETLAAIGQALGQDLNALVNCGAYDRGRVIGEYVSPVFMLKLAGKLAKFSGDLDLSLKSTKYDLECASFVAGTPIWTPNGLVPIESIVEAQWVNSRDSTSYLDEPQQVQSVFSRTAPLYFQLTTESDQIGLTAEHPVWVQGRGWVEAQHVLPGDVLASIDGDSLVISNELINESVEVFNFSVANTPNYFVGLGGLWVHNAVCRLPWVQQMVDFPDVELAPIDRANLFGGPTTGNQSSLRGRLTSGYPNLELYATGTEAAWQAHHVIPWNLRDNPLLQELNFDFNSLHNAIPLPTSRDLNSAAHLGAHKQVYNEAIEEFLEKVDDLVDSDGQPVSKEVKMNAIVDGIENLRESLAQDSIQLNGSPDIAKTDFDQVLNVAIEIANRPYQ